MAGAFRIAEGYVEVTADESGYNRAMDRLKARTHSVTVGVDLDDGAARARLNTLVKPREVKLTADLDTKATSTALQKLTKPRTVKLTVELDNKAAVSGLTALTRDRTVKLTAKLDDTAAKAGLAGLADGQTVSVAPDIQQAAYNRAKKLLDRLTSDRIVRIIASAETRVAADEIRNLTRRQRVRIGIDVDTRVAADDIANLTRRRQMTVQARADTTAAHAALRFLTRDRTVNVRARLLGGLAGLGGAAGSAGMLSSRFVALAGAALTALPAVASLGSAIVQMGPAAAAAVPALGGLVTMGATLAVGMRGVGGAFQAASALSNRGSAEIASAARGVEAANLNVVRSARALEEAHADAARQIADAQKQVQDAAEDVRDAEVRAAADRQAALRRVADAERDLTDAIKDAKQAQDDLTGARKEAAKQLEDLNNRLVDAQLDQRQAVLDLQEAEKELAAVKLKGAAASATDLEEAQLQYDRAVQQLKEQQTETVRLTAETKEANTAGVEGSETVRAAQGRVADAQRNVVDRTRNVRDAQVEASAAAKAGAESVRDAQERLAEAQQGVADAQVAASRQVRTAQEALADAQRSVAAAQAQAATAASKFNDAMAKLSPNARAFVTAVRDMVPAFSALRMEVQDRLFKGLGESVTRLGTAALPALRVGLGGMADNLNQMGRGLMDTFARLADQGLLTRMFQGFNEGFAPLMKIPGQLGQAFVQLSIAASPAFKRMSDAMAGASDRMTKKLTDAFESGRLETAIDHGIEMAKRFGRVLADAYGALKNILGAAATGGGDALTTIGNAFKELRRVTGLPEVQDALSRIFGMFHAIASLVTGVVGAALAGLVPVMAPWADAVAGIADVVKGPLMAFFTWIGEHSTLVGSFASGVLAIVLAMKAWALATTAVTLVHGFLTTAVATLSAAWAANPVGLVVLAIIGLAAAFAYAWHESETFRNIVTGVWEAVKTFFAGTWEWIKKYLIQPFKDAYNILVGNSIIPDMVKAIIGWFTSLWARTKEIFTTLKNWVVNTWNGLWNSVRTKWNSFWSGLRSAISGAMKNVRDTVSSLRTSVTSTWNSLWNGARDKVTSIFSTIRGKISDFRSAMKTAFSTLRDSLGTIWKGIQSKIGAPVKWVVSNVYNNGLRKMWNGIAGKISSKITLPAISLGFNKGGIVPGTGSGDTVPAMLTPKERILSVAQVAKLGGHRAIDAMLGMDRPVKTGGNPSRQDERRQHQPVPGFAEGGIIGSVTSAIGGAAGSVASWAKDVVIGGLKSAASKALSSLVRPLINRIPSSGVGGLLKGLSNKAVDGMMGWFTKEDKKAVGGPAVQKALSWVKTQAGKPYQWAGNGNPSWDCSGLTSAVESVIRGERPHRRWATGSFSGNSGPAGWVRNLNSPYMIGITNSGVGHTAGTIGGVNIESRGGDGVVVGKRARSYKDSLFTSRWGLAPAAKYDSGGLLQPGATMAVNATGRPERILDPQQTALFEQLVTGAGAAGGSITVENITVSGTFDFSSPADRRAAAKALVAEMKEELRKYDKERR